MSHANGSIINGPLKSFIQFNSDRITTALPNTICLAVWKVIKEHAFSTSIEWLALVGGAAEEGCFHLEPNGLWAPRHSQSQKSQQGTWCEQRCGLFWQRQRSQRVAAHSLLAWTRIQLSPIGLLKQRHGLLVRWSMLSESVCMRVNHKLVVSLLFPVCAVQWLKWVFHCASWLLEVRAVPSCSKACESIGDERPLHNRCRTNKRCKNSTSNVHTSRGTNLQRAQWENKFMKRFWHYTPSDKV